MKNYRQHYPILGFMLLAMLLLIGCSPAATSGSESEPEVVEQSAEVAEIEAEEATAEPEPTEEPVPTEEPTVAPEPTEEPQPTVEPQPTN